MYICTRAHARAAASYIQPAGQIIQVKAIERSTGTRIVPLAMPRCTLAERARALLLGLSSCGQHPQNGPKQALWNLNPPILAQ